jgi:hypothetical protein
MARFRNLNAALRSRRLGGEHLEHLALVIYGAPQVVHLAVDPHEDLAHEDLVEMPPPARIRSMLNATLPDLCGKARAKPIPPEPHRLVADIDPALEEQILDLPQRKRM